ncbi:MAG TPA: GxxExxY protein [Caulobacteraceae bacterium]
MNHEPHEPHEPTLSVPLVDLAGARLERAEGAQRPSVPASTVPVRAVREVRGEDDLAGARKPEPQAHESLLYADEVFQIQGAIFEVNRHMGAGFLEAVYQECLAIEFTARGIPFSAIQPLGLTYKGRLLRQSYQADFVCFERIIVELKAVRDLAPEHRAQVLNYLRATGLRLGLLVNFGSAPKARIERLVL